TQCGLRRYPVERTLQLEPRDPGYAFEAEVILRFARNGLPIVQEPISVIYPPEEERVTHFHSVRDPARIVRRVLWTVATVPVRRRRRSSRLGRHEGVTSPGLAYTPRVGCALAMLAVLRFAAMPVEFVLVVGDHEPVARRDPFLELLD